MHILRDCPEEGYKLCKKKLHWYKAKTKGRGCPECKRIYERTRYQTDLRYRQQRIESALKYEAKNQAKYNERKRKKYWVDAEYRRKKLEKGRQNFKAKWHRDPEWRQKKLDKTREWKRKNPQHDTEKTKRRQSRKNKALAKWADINKIKKIYALAVEKTKETGVAHHVDHVFPLCSPFLCGLHVETNLQILAAFENCGKGNRTWPGQLDCQKGSIYDIFSKDLTDLLND